MRRHLLLPLVLAGLAGLTPAAAGAPPACERSATSRSCGAGSAASIAGAQAPGAPDRAGGGGDRARRIAVLDVESLDTAERLAQVLRGVDANNHAVAVEVSAVEAGVLADYDCVIARLTGGDFGPSPETVAAVRGFVADRGGYIGEWQGAAAALSGTAPSGDGGDYYLPERFLGLFKGRASDGSYVGTDTPVDVVARHAVTAGLPTTFTGGGGTEFFVRAVDLDRKLKVLATYEGHGGTHPAVAVGKVRGARSVLLFFDAIDEPGDPELTRLWANSVAYACR